MPDLYLAVECQNDKGHLIPLKRIEFVGQRSKEFMGSAPFNATCQHCKTEQRFLAPQLVLYWEQNPKPDFQDHPNFR